MPLSRREALVRFWGWAAASPLLRAQESPHTPSRRTPVQEILNAEEFEGAARQALSEEEFQRVAAGIGSERTLRRNRQFFQRITFRPRMLIDVTGLDQSIELFGEELFAPMLAGPTARHGQVHAEAEIATVKGAGAAKTAAVISDRSSRDFKDIAAAATTPLWVQVQPGFDAARIESAESVGARAIVLTADGGPRGVSDAERRLGAKQSPATARADADAALAELRKRTTLPVLVKGVIRPDDAKAFVEAGASGIVVSNHGGRSIDGLPASIEALPAVADALSGRVPVLVDGGFRRGTDIVKALALGASAVMLGRPVLWALAAYGAAGVQKLFEVMQHETALAMGLGGKRNVAAVGRDFVKIHSR